LNQNNRLHCPTTADLWLQHPSLTRNMTDWHLSFSLRLLNYTRSFILVLEILLHHFDNVFRLPDLLLLLHNLGLLWHLVGPA